MLDLIARYWLHALGVAALVVGTILDRGYLAIGGLVVVVLAELLPRIEGIVKLTAMGVAVEMNLRDAFTTAVKAVVKEEVRNLARMRVSLLVGEFEDGKDTITWSRWSNAPISVLGYAVGTEMHFEACSECKHEFGSSGLPTPCPNCGATTRRWVHCRARPVDEADASGDDVRLFERREAAGPAIEPP